MDSERHGLCQFVPLPFGALTTNRHFPTANRRPDHQPPANHLRPDHQPPAKYVPYLFADRDCRAFGPLRVGIRYVKPTKSQARSHYPFRDSKPQAWCCSAIGGLHTQLGPTSPDITTAQKFRDMVMVMCAIIVVGDHNVNSPCLWTRACLTQYNFLDQ